MRWIRLLSLCLALGAVVACEDATNPMVGPPDQLVFPGDGGPPDPGDGGPPPDPDPGTPPDPGDGTPGEPGGGGPPPDPGDGRVPYPIITEEEAELLMIRGETTATGKEVVARAYVPWWARIIPAYFLENRINATLTMENSTRRLDSGPDRGPTGYSHTTRMSTGTSCTREEFSLAVHADTDHKAEFRYSTTLGFVTVPYQTPAKAYSDDSFSCDTLIQERTEPADAVCFNAPPVPQGPCAPGGGRPPDGGGRDTFRPPPQWCLVRYWYDLDTGDIVHYRILRCW